MDASGDQSDDQQAEEKPIGFEEQKTIERQEAEAVEEGLIEDVNELPAIHEYGKINPAAYTFINYPTSLALMLVNSIRHLSLPE
jgi:hypothetical protein